MPTVSIILPNYNHAIYLEQRINSILNQTYQDFELIILDDNSSDESHTIINNFKNNPKVSHVLLNHVNSGSTFKQWEKGISISVGEFIWIAESDDYADEGFLAKMVNNLNKHPTVSLAFSQSYYVDKNNEILFSGMNGIEELWKTNTFFESKLALRQFVWHTQIVNASAVVFRRNKYNLINSKEYTNFKVCGDWLFWIKLLEKGDLIHERKELNYFRQHANNVRGSQNVNCIEVLEQLKVYNYLKTNYKELIGEREREKAIERLKYILYVKICLYFNGEKVLKLPLALVKSSIEFPKLTILLPKLIISNLFRKII